MDVLRPSNWRIQALVDELDRKQRANGKADLPDGEYVMKVVDAEFRIIEEGLGCFTVLQIVEGDQMHVALMKGWKIDVNEPETWAAFIVDMMKCGFSQKQIFSTRRSSLQRPFAALLKGRRLIVRYSKVAGGEEAVDIIRRASLSR